MRKKKLENRTHFVYVLKCGSEVVYVGCTSDLEKRLAGHEDKIYTRVDITKFNSKMEALFQERKLLIKFEPKYNWMPKHLLDA